MSDDSKAREASTGYLGKEQRWINESKKEQGYCVEEM